MPPNSYAAGRFLLNLDGTLVNLPTLGGGAIRGEIVTFRTGSGTLPVKRISAVKYEPFRLGVGMGMGQPLYDWIKAMVTGPPVSKSGSFALTNARGKAEAYRNFRDALVQEVTFPALDASNKAAALFEITLSPSEIAHAPGDGADLKATVGAKQKKWLCSNFRFRLTGLEEACKRVAKIDSFTVKQNIAEVASGSSSVRTKQPTTLEIPNLTITLAAADAKPWQDWFDDFVIKGNSGAGNEKNGTIELLDASLKETLGTVTLVRCGIFSLEPGPTGNGVSRYVAELYVQGLDITLNVA
jgi:tail tube protein gp19